MGVGRKGIGLRTAASPGNIKALGELRVKIRSVG